MRGEREGGSERERRERERVRERKREFVVCGDQL
jgi:hypothetical protein